MRDALPKSSHKQGTPCLAVHIGEHILMRGFSKLQVLGCTCPRPVGLQPLDDRIVGVKGAVSRSVRRVGPVCGSGLQGGCAPAGHATGIVQRMHASGHKQLDYNAIGMGAHVC